MADDKPLLYDRKLLYIAPLVIAAVVAILIGAIVFRKPAPATVAQPAPPPVMAAPKPDAAIAAPPPVLTRQGLIAAARNAADVFAATAALPTDAGVLVGRHFAVRIAFGCNGALGAYGASQMSVTYNAANQSVALSATPGMWLGLPVMQALDSAAQLESVEGFWIPRPWTADDACPPPVDYPVPVTPTPATAQTLGLAQLFAASGSRVGQHDGQSYAFTRKLPADSTAALSHSYRLLLEGTITGYGDGKALHCAMESPDHHPVCVFAVSFDHVAFEDTDTGETLANWNE